LILENEYYIEYSRTECPTLENLPKSVRVFGKPRKISPEYAHKNMQKLSGYKKKENFSSYSALKQFFPEFFRITFIKRRILYFMEKGPEKLLKF
jgi:hypothetical protein